MFRRPGRPIRLKAPTDVRRQSGTKRRSPAAKRPCRWRRTSHAQWRVLQGGDIFSLSLLEAGVGFQRVGISCNGCVLREGRCIDTQRPGERGPATSGRPHSPCFPDPDEELVFFAAADAYAVATRQLQRERPTAGCAMKHQDWEALAVPRMVRDAWRALERRGLDPSAPESRERLLVNVGKRQVALEGPRPAVRTLPKPRTGAPAGQFGRCW